MPCESSIRAQALYHIEMHTNPVQWSQEKLQLDPDPWQSDVLQDSSRFIVMVCARQVGKSTIVAVKASHLAVTKAEAKILVVAPSLRQSKELMATIKAMLRIAGETMLKDNETEVMLANHSRIVALPGSEDTVRGFASVDLIVIDEAAFASDSLFYAVYPMIQISRGKMILLSSAYITNGFFYDIWHNDDRKWSRYQITAYDCPRYDQAELEEIRQWTPARQFQCEYLAQFVDPDGAAFSAEEIERSIDMDLEPFVMSEHEDVLDDTMEAFG